MDVSGLDAVVIAGYPGTRASPVAAGRPRRALGRAPGDPWSPATTRWTPSWSTTPRRSSAARSSRPSSIPTTPTSSPPSVRRRLLNFPSPSPTLALFGPAVPTCCWLGTPACCAAVPRAGTGPAGSGPPTSPTSGAAAATVRIVRAVPAGCSAQSTGAASRLRPRGRRPPSAGPHLSGPRARPEGLRGPRRRRTRPYSTTARDTTAISRPVHRHRGPLGAWRPPLLPARQGHQPESSPSSAAD